MWDSRKMGHSGWWRTLTSNLLEELSTKLLEFWESPHPTTDTFLADKEQKGKNRKEKAPTSRIASSREASEEASVKEIEEVDTDEHYRPKSPIRIINVTRKEKV
ncbi:hypothetical protein LOK49_LG12G00706 [Camellia lanceoleosa]|uniref:Uncharacterized protein n=1 Tax=Camellia lanceoleosa TaxID=1840588 RepID=A0ACC0FTV3_9ERIC|nr:hypothetical protein LOK49_LG12G00706 [Camellia lanceoleosa]